LRVGNERFAQGDLVGFLGNLATEMNPEARMSLTASQVRFAFFSFPFLCFAQGWWAVSGNAESLRGGGDVRGLAGGPGAHL
jgi:hypothetical protein